MIEELKQYILQLVKDIYPCEKGYKNEGLYILCSALAVIKLAEGTNFGEEKWKYFFHINTIVEHYYDEALKNEGELELL